MIHADLLRSIESMRRNRSSVDPRTGDDRHGVCRQADTGWDDSPMPRRESDRGAGGLPP